VFFFFVQTAAVVLWPVSDSLSWINILNFAPQDSSGPTCIVRVVFTRHPFARLAATISSPVSCYSFAQVELDGYQKVRLLPLPSRPQHARCRVSACLFVCLFVRRCF
jgi:hypothetical protein